MKPTIALFLFLATLFANSSAFAKLIDFKLDSLAPDQQWAGLAEVEEKAKAFLAEAESIAESKGTKVEDELNKVLKRELQQQGVMGFCSPDGWARITDGHHKVLAALRDLIKEREDIDSSKITFQADLPKDGDFRVKGRKPTEEDWIAYAKYRQKTKPTYFPESFDVDHKSIKEIAQYYKDLPTKFEFGDGPEYIHDSPMRSATGKLFDYLGIKGTSFKPYIQFRLGERLASPPLNIKVHPGEEFSFKVQKVIRDAVFFSKESGNLLKLLENAAVDGHEKEVSQGLKYLNSLIHTDTAKSANSIESLYGALPEGTKIEDLSLPLPKTPEEVSQLLEDAQKRYVERVNLDKVEGLLKKLKDGKSLDGDEIKYLKDARKSSLNLRSAILTLGTKNAKEAFESVRNYVTQLGNVNDRLGKLDDDDDVPKALQEQAEDTLDIYKKIKRKNLLNAKIPARSPEELQQVNAEFLKQLKGILARNKSLLALGKDTLRKILKGKKAVDPSMRITIGEYHDVRKMLRDLMGVLQLITERNPSPEANAALNFVNQVQKKMGKMKDGFEIPVDEKAAVKFDMHPTLIDASTQKDLESIEKMMENLKDTSKIGAGAAVSGANCAKHFSGLK